MNKPIGPSELGFRIARRLSKEFGGGQELPTSMLHLIANVVDSEIAQLKSDKAAVQPLPQHNDTMKTQ